MPLEVTEVPIASETRTPEIAGVLPVVSTNGFPKPAMVQRLLDLFYLLHHDVEFCSFIHRHSFDLRQPQSPFLIASIIALSALYIYDDEARENFGFATSAGLSRNYLSKARDLSRELSQSPCGPSTFLNSIGLIYKSSSDANSECLSLEHTVQPNPCTVRASLLERDQGLHVRRVGHPNGTDNATRKGV